MNDELDAKFRSSFCQLHLPRAPMSLLLALDRLEAGFITPAPTKRPRARWLRLMAATGSLGLVAVFSTLMLQIAGRADAQPFGSAAPMLTQGNPSSSPGLTVNEAIALRDAGGLGADEITVVGFWTSEPGTDCPAFAAPGPAIHAAVWCRDGEYGIGDTPQGPYLTPYIPPRLDGWKRLGGPGQSVQPVPVSMRGHFNDPTAVECLPELGLDVQRCRERFVVDEILFVGSGVSSEAPSSPGVPSTAPIESLSPSPAMTVTEALALRDAGQVGSDEITVVGYWSSVPERHACFPVWQNEPQNNCAVGWYGITDLNEPFMKNGYSISGEQLSWPLPPADGPFLAAFVPRYLEDRLPAGEYLTRSFIPPTHVVVVGHFNGRSERICGPFYLEDCVERFVIDEVLQFDPARSTPPTSESR